MGGRKNPSTLETLHLNPKKYSGSPKSQTPKPSTLKTLNLNPKKYSSTLQYDAMLLAALAREAEGKAGIGGFRAYRVLGFRVWGLGFRVWGLWFRGIESRSAGPRSRFIGPRQKRLGV